jgi:hypothetical protein
MSLDDDLKYTHLEQFLQARRTWFRPIGESVTPLSDQIIQLSEMLPSGNVISDIILTTNTAILFHLLPTVPKAIPNPQEDFRGIITQKRKEGEL